MDMKTSLLDLCSLFIENRDTVKAALSWDNSYIYPVCAAIFTDKRLRADSDRLKACRDLLKGETGPFSSFRGTAKLATISMLAADEEPETLLQRGLTVYQALKAHFSGSQYLPVAAMILANLTEPARYEEVSARTRAVYKLMKQEHPFLTGGEDSVFAALLALSPLSDQEIVAETEACYERLKPAFHSGNAVQSLSHVLALGEGGAGEKCDKTLALYDKLRDREYRYGVSYELATLGSLALLPGEPDELADDTAQVADWLAEQKGYGVFGVGKKQRLMHAGMLVTSDRIGDAQRSAMGPAALGAVVSLIAAQQAAICAAVAASSAASASSS